MKAKKEIDTFFDKFEELNDKRCIYNNCFTLDNRVKNDYPSLKYANYHMNFFNAFHNDLIALKRDAKKLLVQLNNYKGDKINTPQEKEKINKIISELIEINKNEDNEYEYYDKFLAVIAKNYDTFKTKESEDIYKNTSEDILYIRIKNFLKYEKTFIIFKEIINKLNNYF